MIKTILFFLITVLFISYNPSSVHASTQAETAISTRKTLKHLDEKYFRFSTTFKIQLLLDRKDISTEDITTFFNLIKEALVDFPEITFDDHNLSIKMPYSLDEASWFIQHTSYNQKIKEFKDQHHVRGTFLNFYVDYEYGSKHMKKLSKFSNNLLDDAKKHNAQNADKRIKTTKQDSIASLLHNNKGICIGEYHDELASIAFIMENINFFKENGVSTLYIEHLKYDSYSTEQMNNTKTIPPCLASWLDIYDSKYEHSNSKYNLKKLIAYALEQGMRVIPIDTTASYACGTTRKEGVTNLPDRCHGMNYTAHRIMETTNDNKKFIALMGMSHLNNGNSTVPGVAELFSCPSIAIKASKQSTSLTLNKGLHDVSFCSAIIDYNLNEKFDPKKKFCDYECEDYEEIRKQKKEEQEKYDTVLEQKNTKIDLLLQNIKSRNFLSFLNNWDETTISTGTIIRNHTIATVNNTYWLPLRFIDFAAYHNNYEVFNFLVNKNSAGTSQALAIVLTTENPDIRIVNMCLQKLSDSDIKSFFSQYEKNLVIKHLDLLNKTEDKRLINLHKRKSLPQPIPCPTLINEPTTETQKTSPTPAMPEPFSIHDNPQKSSSSTTESTQIKPNMNKPTLPIQQQKTISQNTNQINKGINLISILISSGAIFFDYINFDECKNTKEDKQSTQDTNENSNHQQQKAPLKKEHSTTKWQEYLNDLFKNPSQHKISIFGTCGLIASLLHTFMR